MTGVDPTHLCQIEIPVSDFTRAVTFYEQAFGWTRAPAALHEYVVLTVPESCPFGLALVPGTEGRPRRGPLLYFAVEDPEELCLRVESVGGRRVLGPVKLMGYGSIWHIEDTEGNRWGLYRKNQAPPPVRA